MKTILEYTGKHQAKGEYEMEEEKAESLLDSGEWTKKGESAPTKPVKPSTMPNENWTEKRIKYWLEVENIPISYSITNDEKADKLKEINDYFQ